jgi:hypothetical protein
VGIKAGAAELRRGSGAIVPGDVEVRYCWYLGGDTGACACRLWRWYCCPGRATDPNNEGDEVAEVAQIEGEAPEGLGADNRAAVGVNETAAAVTCTFAVLTAAEAAAAAAEADSR